MNIKWLYERDYRSLDQAYIIAEYWLQLGYRVFLQGYSAINCREVT